jgi:hypothetical protein
MSKYIIILCHFKFLILKYTNHPPIDPYKNQFIIIKSKASLRPMNNMDFKYFFSPIIHSSFALTPLSPPTPPLQKPSIHSSNGLILTPFLPSQQRRLPSLLLDARPQGPHLPRLDRAPGGSGIGPTELQGLPRRRLHARDGANAEYRLCHREWSGGRDVVGSDAGRSNGGQLVAGVVMDGL